MFFNEKTAEAFPILSLNRFKSEILKLPLICESFAILPSIFNDNLGFDSRILKGNTSESIETFNNLFSFLNDAILFEAYKRESSLS